MSGNSPMMRLMYVGLDSPHAFLRRSTQSFDAKTPCSEASTFWPVNSGVSIERICFTVQPDPGLQTWAMYDAGSVGLPHASTMAPSFDASESAASQRS